MGVLACDRTNCENIMCDRIDLSGRYYICYECFEEFVKSNHPIYDLEGFMDSPKPDFDSKSTENARRAYLDNVFRVM